ncbi:MAG: NAD(P)/FAD-dependent oxidoreductase [Candidatus Korarchaeota archaeon]|nr:NAD(P)/FAD-dependent oxidoreductase [Candidatus Korarchaeota archaeon]
MPLYDVIVVGAGPSGSTAARLLSESGFRVLLVERARHPRRKVCGGALSLRAVRRYGIPIEEAAEIRDVFLWGPGGVEVVVPSDRPVGYLMPRERLDEILFRRALESGAEAVQGEAVVNVDVSGEGVLVTTTRDRYSARAVVGADGFASRVRESLGLTPRGWFTYNAFCPVCYVPLDSAGELAGDAEFYLGVYGEGYAWIFKHRDHLNVGIGTFLGNYKFHPATLLVEFLRGHSEASSRVLRVPQESMIVGSYIPYDGAIPKTYSERALLVGDSAGFVSTLTGEGIYHAMLSSELAVDVLSRSLEEGDLSEERLSEYQRRWLQEPELGEMLAYGKLLRNLLFKDPRLLSRVLKAASEDAELARLIRDIVFGLKGYKAGAWELARRIPLRVAMDMLLLAPGDVFRLAAGSSSPFFGGGKV